MQQCFTISEVAANWHELMIPQHIMWASIVRTSEHLDPWSNVKCNSDYSVENDESLHGHCTDKRRDGKRDKKVRRDVT